MKKMQQVSELDKIERKLVFRVSRGFFWIYVTLACLAFIGAIIVLVYSVIPASERDVLKGEYPPKPQITQEEIILSLSTKPKSQDQQVNQYNSYEGEQQTNQNYDNQEPIQIDVKKERINLLLDSLRTFIPSYGTRYDFERVLGKYFKTDQEKISTLDFIISLIQRVEEDKRDMALRYFITSVYDKWEPYMNARRNIDSNYDMEIIQAKNEYEKTRANKEKSLMISFYIMGGALIIIALVGLILSFLAIERNTRAVKELLEQQKVTNE